jgi:hypothetical protein
MKAGQSSEDKVLPLTNSATGERKPSWQSMSWHGSIGNSEFTLLYEFTDASGNVKLA